MRRFVTFSKGLRILVMVSMVLALVASMAGTALAQAPKLEVTPALVPATTTLVAKVTGFKPKEAVVVLLVGALAGEDIILTGGECNDKGEFSSPAKRIPQVAEMATVPAGVKPGKYTIKATGTAGSTATADIEVGVAPTPTPKPVATPKPAGTPAAKPAGTPAAKPAATPAAAAKAPVPKTGAPIPITLIAMAGVGLGVLGFALRRRV
ncbi:MAG: hypothetical protein HYX92_13235 [Chloroflexi bacterium]|nr:hypothetical protein [Chloroflexota bacterium]